MNRVMQYGFATVQKVIDGHNCVIGVRVCVTQPFERVGHCVRVSTDANEPSTSAGAQSGVLFAQRRVGCDNYDIEIQEITGDIHCPMAGMGAALAATLAVWAATGDEWNERDLGDLYGWSVDRCKF
jgi:hypothetical protein